MMQGITVLSSISVITSYKYVFTWTTPLYFFLIITLMAFLSLIEQVGIKRKFSWKSNIGFALSAICVIIFLFVGFEKVPETEVIIYKVSIDDTVNLNEFMEQYQLLSREGSVYEITEWNEQNPQPNYEEYKCTRQHPYNDSSNSNK